MNFQLIETLLKLNNFLLSSVNCDRELREFTQIFNVLREGAYFRILISYKLQLNSSNETGGNSKIIMINFQSIAFGKDFTSNLTGKSLSLKWDIILIKVEISNVKQSDKTAEILYL